jgi:hypothetical protein
VKKGVPGLNFLALCTKPLQPVGGLLRLTRLLRLNARSFVFLRLDAPPLRVRYARC